MRCASIAGTLVAAFGAWQASAKSITEQSLDVRTANILRVTKKACPECSGMEEIYAKNELVFLLIYERALMGQQHYKTAIVSGFHQACEELRYSYITCGVIDIVEDRELAEMYIDPKTAPAHILVRDSSPLEMQKYHVDTLMKKPGDVETILWHLGDLLGSGPWSSLRISTEVSSMSDFQSTLRGHKSTVVVALPASAGKVARNELRAVAQTLVRSGVLGVDAAPAALPKKGKRKKRPLHFVLCTEKKIWKEYGLQEGTVVAFNKEVKVPGATLDLPDAARALDAAAREQQTLEAFKQLAELAIKNDKDKKGEQSTNGEL